MNAHTHAAHHPCMTCVRVCMCGGQGVWVAGRHLPTAHACTPHMHPALPHTHHPPTCLPPTLPMHAPCPCMHPAHTPHPCTLPSCTPTALLHTHRPPAH